MSTPGFTALSALRGGTPLGPLVHVPRQPLNHIVPQSLPPQCQGAQGFTNTTCYGVVLVCQDCCKLWNFQQSQYVDVCGGSYVCGACIGFPW
jgi:hypothetical protein